MMLGTQKVLEILDFKQEGYLRKCDLNIIYKKNLLQSKLNQKLTKKGQKNFS